MRGKSKISTKINPWKEKAKERSKIIAYQKKRISEIIEGRIGWKVKYFELRKCYEAQQKELEKLRGLQNTSIEYHSYSGEVMQLCLQLRTQAGCSFRSCIKVLQILVVLLNLEIKIPSYSSVRNWEIKLGYQQIQEQANPSDKWVLIIDESISIGNQKMLLLIGVNIGNYSFTQALRLSDIKVLAIRLSKSWKAPEIEQVVEEVGSRGYQFEYCCCDNGNNLRKLLKTLDLVHIEDCGHSLGNWLKNKYKEEEVFQSFCTQTTKVKRQLILSKYAEYVPPKHRTKGRFLNLSAIAVWAKKLLFLAKQYEQTGKNKAAFEKIKWILAYESFIIELNKEQALINKVNKVIKNKGLSDSTIVECEELIESSQADKQLKEYIRDYLKRNRNKLPNLAQIICSSDIIESMFGKFKYNTSKSPNGAITEGCLSVANYGKKFEINEIKNAMEQVRIADIKNWRKENLPISTQQKRRRLMQKAS